MDDIRVTLNTPISESQCFQTQAYRSRVMGIHDNLSPKKRWNRYHHVIDTSTNEVDKQESKSISY